MYSEYICAAVRFNKRERDGHLAAHRRIIRLELHGFDNLFIRHELDKAAMIRVGVCSRFAGPSRRIIGERDAERTAFDSVESMHMAGHITRHHPHCDRVCIEKQSIHGCTRCAHMLSEVSRGRSHTLYLLNDVSLPDTFPVPERRGGSLWVTPMLDTRGNQYRRASSQPQ